MTNQETCIRCCRSAGYNRIVIDEQTDRVVGGFCRSCELGLFGRTLSSVQFEDDSCTLCERDGFYLLSPWRPEARAEDDGTVTVTGEFRIDDVDPRLCDRHHYELSHPEADAFASDRRAPSVDHIR